MDDLIKSLDRQKPLVICDADEVLLRFVEALELWLPENGYIVDFKSFSLTDSIRDQSTGEAVRQRDMETLLDRFFAERVAQIEAVPHAADSLGLLSARADIIILSNVPAAQRDRRRASLAALGMDYPVIANRGSKGPVMKQLCSNHQAPVIFVDDLPPHHTAVAAAVPAVHRLHFVADARLARLIPPASDAHHRLDCWLQARSWIGDKIDLWERGQ